MQEISTYLQHKGSLLLHPQYTSYMVIQSQKLTLNEGSLFLQFHLKTLESLRYQGTNKKPILTVWVGVNFMIEVKLEKISSKYIFEEGRYSNEVTVSCTDLLNKKKQQIYSKQVRFCCEELIQVQIKIKSFKEQQLFRKIVVEFGSKGNKEAIKAKVINLRIASKPMLFQPTDYPEKQAEQGALDTLPLNECPNFQQLPKYEAFSEKQLEGKHLYVCHDMKGGYIEDTNSTNPFHANSNSYRLLLLGHCYIFNYFSHHLITIPPEHWRRACHTHKCLCLGTFIIEGNRLKSSEYLTDNTINMLAYFCRNYKFDGYLINIEHQVHSVQKLVQFLKKLYETLHKAVNNSKIIWYDSVSSQSGTIKYQNELNEHNTLFYNNSDGIFLNYWWNQNKLINSLKHYQNGKPIFVGSDCFGRGTYGGGQFNTFKAMNTIMEINKKYSDFKIPLKPTLFATGYTYEGEAQRNIQLWKLHQKAMYRGIAFKQIPISQKNWQYRNNNVNGHNWNIEGQWAVASFRECCRVLQLPVKKLGMDFGQQLQAKFMCTVKGTGPNFADPYTIGIQAYQRNFPFYEQNTGNRVTSQNQEIIDLSLKFDTDIITPETSLLIYQKGSDAQKWAGHYGARFKKQSLFIRTYFSQRDWIKNFDLPLISLPYQTNFNIGHGQTFFYFGKEFKIPNKKYNYLSDLEMPVVYSLNNPDSVDICYSDAYIGGTSLMVTGLAEVKLGNFDLKSLAFSDSQVVTVRVVFKKKNGQKMKLKCLIRDKKEKKQMKLTHWQLMDNKWILSTFIFESKNLEDSSISLFLGLPNSDTSIIVGQLAVFSSQPPKIQQPAFESINIVQSDINPPIRTLCFNISITMKNSCKLLIHINDEFACFCYADHFNQNVIKLDDVFLQQSFQKMQITLSALSKQVKYQPLYVLYR